MALSFLSAVSQEVNKNPENSDEVIVQLFRHVCDDSAVVVEHYLKRHQKCNMNILNSYGISLLATAVKFNPEPLKVVPLLLQVTFISWKIVQIQGQIYYVA